MVWEIDDSWNLHFEKAKVFYDKNGNLDIPAEYETEDGIKLGRWYRTRLREYRNGLLSCEKMKQLEAIGIQTESVIKRNWMRNYDLAKRFFEQNGHLTIDHDYVTENGIKLGIWISSQRAKYKHGDLTKEQIFLLEKIVMHWDRFDSKWESFYAVAVAYYEANGNLLFPSTYETSEGIKLGAWLVEQKKKYKGNKLTKIQIERLEKIGIIWSQFDQAWAEGYRHAKEYALKNGNLNVRTGYVCDDGFKLFTWIQNKRTAYMQGRLSDERIAQLDRLGMIWKKSDKKEEKLLKGQKISSVHTSV